MLPGLIEGHSHLLLHPYNETSWNDQVLKESAAERAIRGAVHAEKSLMAGVTTMRDLGSEGAGYADVALKKSIDAGIIPGPRLLVAGPAIVATGAYGPKGFHEGVNVPLGAEPASGVGEVIAAVRRQMGGGADFIKIYADYRWTPGAQSQPTFLPQELEAIVHAAKSAGKYAVAHASTPEGMKRAILAGVETIEHGDAATQDTYELMKANQTVLYPTLAAGDAIERYNGWDGKKDTDRIRLKKESFALALASGVTIGFGGDVGVYPHGENYRELELMVAYGMSASAVLKAATDINARTFHLKSLGRVRDGYLADLIAVEGDPPKISVQCVPYLLSCLTGKSLRKTFEAGNRNGPLKGFGDDSSTIRKQDLALTAAHSVYRLLIDPASLFLQDGFRFQALQFSFQF